jgi:ABC-type Fe3+ transport system substrate-binding protein
MLDRRHLLKSLSLSALALAPWIRPARAAETVVVVTSFPEELTTRFEELFERQNPGLHMQIVWKQGRDAFAEMSKPDQGGIDLYWSPALDTFPMLKDAGAFRKLEIDRTGLPGKIGGQPISDPEGYYEASEVAGYGIAANSALLAQRGLKTPKSWRDLADPAYAGQIAVPVPARVGFSPALYDIILQSEGWEAGWSLLSQIAANANLSIGGNRLSTAVAEGQVPLALTIDFFPLIAAANGTAVSMIYPDKTTFLPTHIAITRSAPHPEAAKVLAQFLVSEDAQKLLLHPDIRRHPIRPAVYREAQAGFVDPFATKDFDIGYDPEAGRWQRWTIAPLFDVAITERQSANAELWAAIRSAEAKAKDPAATTTLAEARQLAGSVPLTGQEARKPDIAGKLRNEAGRAELIAQWREAKKAADAKAWTLLRNVTGAK